MEINKPIMSICVAAYNQIHLVEENINEFIKYSGKDVEMIISDDCSPEDILGIVSRCNDKRVKYVRTETNGGHDKNIINALKNARGKYALLLRSRDKVIPEKIKDIVRIIKENDGIAYALFSAEDENGYVKLKLRDKVYKKGIEAIEAHNKLLIHPSGSIYNTELIDYDSLRSSIDEHFNHKFGFSVHQLIRMDLACKGDFITSSEVAWIYVNTKDQKDKAVNSFGNGICVYDPRIEYERYRCEYDYLAGMKVNKSKEKRKLYSSIIKRYYRSIAYSFESINNNVKMQEHYDYKPVPYNKDTERKEFIRRTELMIVNLEKSERIIIIILLRLYGLKLKYYYPLRDNILKNMTKEQMRDIHRMIKGI